MKTLNINGKYLSQAVTGVQRYARDVVQAWDDAMEEGLIDRSRFSIQVVAPKTILTPPEYRHIRVSSSWLAGKAWDQFELPIRTAGTLLFSPYAAAPAFKRRHVVTIHDAGVHVTPQQYSALFRIYYSAVYWLIGKFSRRVFTVSQFSKGELQHYFSIRPVKLSVISPGCDHLSKTVPDLRILNRFNLKPGKFILGVSSQSPIKNFAGLAESWGLLERRGIRLAIAGKTNDRIFRQIQPKSEEDIAWLGYVTDEELRALYENAALFAYPSFYEGFGYPPLEAMYFGCPVVVGRSSALPETCGDAAVYCEPSDPHDIARSIAAVLDSPELAADLRENGKRRAAQFTMKKTAMKLWAEISAYL